MFTVHFMRLAFGLPALLIVFAALRKSSDAFHPFVWVLAIITAGAPLAIGYIWTRNPIGGVLYALLTYSAAGGFAIRLVNRNISYRFHWPLLILFVTSAVTAFITIATVVLPAIHNITVTADISEPDSDSEVQQSLGRVDAALLNMQLEQQKLQTSVRSVVDNIRVRGLRIHDMQQRRDRLMEELRAAEKLKELSNEELAELSKSLHRTHWTDNFISFVVGVLSSVTAALALKFFAPSD